MKKEYLTYLKKSLLLNENLPDFYEDNSYYNVRNVFNCYAYAMGFKLPNEYILKYNEKDFNRGEDTVRFRPGFTALNNIIHYYSIDELIEKLYFDCDSLGISIAKSNIHGKNKTDGYKIALYCSYFVCGELYDFHFIRQNKDLSWSDKNGYINEPKIITIMDSYKCSSSSVIKYEFIDCYEIFKEKNLVKK